MARAYRLGRRQPEIERTRSSILSAARQVITELGAGASISRVAERAGVSRITVYNQFGSKAQLLDTLAAGPRFVDRTDAAAPSTSPSDELRARIDRACAAWAADPALYRQLEGHHQPAEQSELDHALAVSLGAHDLLRPGCSIREAEDVIGVLTSFQVFDRLHKGGRRSPAAVAEILLGMASSVTGPHAAV